MTYTDFFRLADFPFQLTPDCRFFYDARPHCKAMAYLSYGLNKGEGFVVVTGEVGAGKTMLIEQLLSLLKDAEVLSARIVSTQVGADDILRLVAAGFGIDVEGASKAVVFRRTENFLCRDEVVGRRRFVIVDEAQCLPFSALEELRMLSNCSVGNRPAVQIFLIGQPEFRQMVSSDRLEALRQRVVASCHLAGLDEADTRAYIEHRLRMVGWRSDPSLTDDAFERIFETTAGIPRRINATCDRLLLFASIEEKHHLNARDVEDTVIDMKKDLMTPFVAVQGKAQ